MLTWFGITLIIYYVLNILCSVYYAGNGGLTVTPGSLIFSAVVQCLIIYAIVAVGTGVG